MAKWILGHANSFGYFHSHFGVETHPSAWSLTTDALYKELRQMVFSFETVDVPFILMNSLRSKITADDDADFARMRDKENDRKTRSDVKFKTKEITSFFNLIMSRH